MEATINKEKELFIIPSNYLEEYAINAWLSERAPMKDVIRVKCIEEKRD